MYPYPVTSPSGSTLNVFSLLTMFFARFFTNLDILLPILLFGLPAFSWLPEEPPYLFPFLQLSFHNVLLEEVRLHQAWHLRQTFPSPASMPLCGLLRDPTGDEVVEFGFTFIFSELWVFDFPLGVHHIFTFRHLILSSSVQFDLLNAIAPFQVPFWPTYLFLRGHEHIWLTFRLILLLIILFFSSNLQIFPHNI